MENIDTKEVYHVADVAVLRSRSHFHIGIHRLSRSAEVCGESVKSRFEVTQ